MNILLYLLFFSIFFLDYLTLNLQIIPRYLALVPEMLSVLTLIIAFLLVAINKRIAIKTKYVFFFLIFFLHILGGILINTVPAGAIFAGFRVYLKGIPFFLLPAAYDFSDREIRKQINFLLVLALFQLPMAVYQRFVQAKGVLSGDAVRGTLNTSSTLTIFLVSAVALLLAFFYKKKIKWPLFIVILFFLFLPTTLNETKGTVILLPLALIVPTVFMPGIKGKARNMLISLTLVILLIGTFIPIYDHYMQPRWGYGIKDFYTSEIRLQRALAPHTTGTNPDSIGRIDAIIFPFRILSDEPLKWFTGLGIGNISRSFLKGFQGEYSQYSYLVAGALSKLLWEIGIIGVMLFLVFYYLVFSDASEIKRREDISGTIALGWTAVLVILVVCLIYNNYIVRNVPVYLSWYISGYIAAKRCRLDLHNYSTQKRTIL